MSTQILKGQNNGVSGKQKFVIHEKIDKVFFNVRRERK